MQSSSLRISLAWAAGFLPLALTFLLLFPPSLGCRTVPISGRRQMLLVPESQEVALGIEAYKQALANETLSTNPQYVDMVRQVGSRIAQAAQRPDYQWEFNVVASKEQNAFALPGGKVVIHEGILPVCQNEAGLAVVMAHEVAHAVSRHGGERMGHESVVKGLGGLLSYASNGQDPIQQERIMQAFGLASKYGFVLPYSRKHESEADQVGIILMARAGYDPSEAPRFWERFGSMAAGQKPPEWLSTHPSDERRSIELRAMLPVALAEYERAPVRLGLGNPLPTSGPAHLASHTTTEPPVTGQGLAPTPPKSDPWGDPYGPPSLRTTTAPPIAR